ncbi:hypothetical protein V1478_001151 [Vespula squamosa]|uniref:Uncharacterized protein n=1 Tax=Vespula squamosa TaxID=30214 RepID=A0ABD2C857_VESSQ
MSPGLGTLGDPSFGPHKTRRRTRSLSVPIKPYWRGPGEVPVGEEKLHIRGSGPLLFSPSSPKSNRTHPTLVLFRSH